MNSFDGVTPARFAEYTWVKFSFKNFQHCVFGNTHRTKLRGYKHAAIFNINNFQHNSKKRRYERSAWKDKSWAFSNLKSDVNNWARALEMWLVRTHRFKTNVRTLMRSGRVPRITGGDSNFRPLVNRVFDKVASAGLAKTGS